MAAKRKKQIQNVNLSICRICGSDFTSRVGLASHMRIHDFGGKGSVGAGGRNVRAKRSNQDVVREEVDPPSSPESLIGIQPGQDGYSSMDYSDVDSSASSDSSSSGSTRTCGTNSTTGSERSSSGESDDDELTEIERNYVIPANTGHYYPVISGEDNILLRLPHHRPSHSNLVEICLRFRHDTMPGAYSKLGAIPNKILEGAMLINELNLSRAAVAKVHRYMCLFATERGHHEYLDARTIKKYVRNACKRSVGNGGGKLVASYKPKPGKGVPEQIIEFEVRSIVVAGCGDLTFCSPINFYI